MIRWAWAIPYPVRGKKSQLCISIAVASAVLQCRRTTLSIFPSEKIPGCHEFVSASKWQHVQEMTSPTLKPNRADVLLTGLDLTGTFVFAVEGALAAVAGNLDFFGLLVLSFATALGGGVVRDLLIGATPPQSLRIGVMQPPPSWEAHRCFSSII